MKRIVYEGPAEEIAFRIGARQVTFTRGEAIEVADELAEELLALNPENVTIEEALRGGASSAQIFREETGGGD